MVKRKREGGGFGSAFLPLFGLAFICSNRARKWIAGRWNEKEQKRMNRRISENNTLCPRSTATIPPPLPFPNHPGTSYINIWLPMVFVGMMQCEPLTEAKDTGCFLPNIAFVRFISSSPSHLPSPLFRWDRRYFYWAENCPLASVARCGGCDHSRKGIFLLLFWQVKIFTHEGEDKNFLFSTGMLDVSTRVVGRVQDNVCRRSWKKRKINLCTSGLFHSVEPATIDLDPCIRCVRWPHNIIIHKIRL